MGSVKENAAIQCSAVITNRTHMFFGRRFTNYGACAMRATTFFILADTIHATEKREWLKSKPILNDGWKSYETSLGKTTNIEHRCLAAFSATCNVSILAPSSAVAIDICTANQITIHENAKPTMMREIWSMLSCGGFCDRRYFHEQTKNCGQNGNSQLYDA